MIALNSTKRSMRTLLSILLCSLSLQQAFADSGKLMAGTGKINITPKTDQKIHDSVYARSLVLEVQGQRLAFVSLDLPIFTSDRVVEACKRQFNIARVILSSSHNHSAPMVDNKINVSESSPFQPYYEAQIIKVVGEAVANMFPAKIAAGKSTFPQLGFNRLIVREDGKARESWIADDHYRRENPERIPFGPVDPELGVLKITDLENNPKAIVMNYAMHADIVCFNYEVSADYPGVASRKVEASFGDKVTCLFVNGGGGNVESLMISPRKSGPDDTSTKTDYAPMERTGELLAWEVTKLARNISMPATGETDIRYKVDSLKFTGRYDSKRIFNVHLITMLINNNISVAVCPGEMFVQFQLDWKDKMKLAGVNGFMFGYSWSGGKWPGYIPDVRSAALGGYGADGDNLIQVGAGEQIVTKHLENYYKLTGLIRSSL